MNSDLGGEQQHRAVFGSYKEGHVEYPQIAWLAWLQINSPLCTQELIVFSFCAGQQSTRKKYWINI